MKLQPFIRFAGRAIVYFVSVAIISGAKAASVNPTQVLSEGSAGSSLNILLQPSSSALPVPKVRYLLCRADEISAEHRIRATPLNYFTYFDITRFDLERNFEQTSPVVGVVRQLSGSGTYDYVSAKSEGLWYWGYYDEDSGQSENSFSSSDFPQLDILCDTPERANSWVKFKGVYQAERYPSYEVYDYSTSESVKSSLCAYEYNHQLITGVVIEKDNGHYANLNFPYLCAAINVLRAYPRQLIIYTEPAGWAMEADLEAFIPIYGEVDYLLAETSAKEPEMSAACETMMNWSFPETVIPPRYTTNLNDIIGSYPPENSIRYCMGYTTDSRNHLIKTVGLELGEFNYISRDSGIPEEQKIHTLAGGCYFPGAFSLRPLPFLTPDQSPNDLWTARYRAVSVPVDTGWSNYDPVQNPGIKASCQGTEADSAPVYFCRFVNPENITAYVYGVFTPAAGNECRAITLLQGECPEYGRTASSEFMVYTQSVDSVEATRVTSTVAIPEIKETPLAKSVEFIGGLVEEKSDSKTTVSATDDTASAANIITMSLPAGLISLMISLVIPGL